MVRSHMTIRFGRYETLEALAVGGMAKVYRGVARSEGGFERPIAIKVMHPHIATDPDFVNMFLDEARVAAKIHHPNVVATHDIQRSPTGIFLVMDLVDGVDLGLLLRAARKHGQRLELGVVVRILIETLKGLQAAHELKGSDGNSLNVVHRDVSPQNILVDRTGFVKITDFGVAHAAERLTTTHGGELKGKMGYLAPEHIKEGKIDARSDVYAAGVVLWELLTSERLFKADERVSVLADIMAGRIASPAVHVPDLPAPLTAVCLKALALEPSARFRSAAEFAAGIRSAAEQSEIRLAEAEDLAALVRSCHALELAASSREQLNRDESTQADVTVLEPLPLDLLQRARRTDVRNWLTLALGLVLALSGVLYGTLKDAPSPPPSLSVNTPNADPPAASIPASSESAPRAQPDNDTQPTSESPKVEPSTKRAPQRPQVTSENRMYHPSGL